jgi:hypothetical protein
MRAPSNPTAFVQLAVYVCANGGSELGAVRLDEPIWLWAGDGGFAVEPGTHDVGELAASWSARSLPFPVQLDVWGDSGAGDSEGRWAALLPEDPRLRDVPTVVMSFAAAMRAMTDYLPRVSAWVGTVTRVAAPFVPEASSAVFRSASVRDVPGVIWLDVTENILTTLEALVHESAHHHLYLYEREGSLIAGDDAPRFSSPLREEPRPLRGILMAFHALAYIGAMYADAAGRAIPVDRAVVERSLADTIALMLQAEQTLHENMDQLTESGRAFLERTSSVAAYARA